MEYAREYPRAIVHFDADSFFASVEQVMDYRLRGKAVVTGGERGAATSVSVEAKRLGLSRGMSLQEMKRLVPDVVVVTSDYTSYSIFAYRMYAIAREFTPYVEEYSIDECFADITLPGVVAPGTYEAIAQKMKDRLEEALGITFGVGLGPSKTIAKIASKLNKPSGLTCIPVSNIDDRIRNMPMGALWGVGFSTSLALERAGVTTAMQFKEKSDGWLRDHGVSKPYRDIWLELRGAYVRPVTSIPDDSIGSILKSRTFTPSRDPAFIRSQLAHNIELACAKARRHHVKASHIRFYLKTQSFTYAGLHLSFTVPQNDPRELLRLVDAHFDRVYEPGTEYRASGIALYSIVPEHAAMPDLFGESVRLGKGTQLLTALDGLNQKYGSSTVYLGSSARAIAHGSMRAAERATRARSKLHMPIQLKKKTLSVPFLGIAHVGKKHTSS